VGGFCVFGGVWLWLKGGFAPLPLLRCGSLGYGVSIFLLLLLKFINSLFMIKIKDVTEKVWIGLIVKGIIAILALLFSASTAKIITDFIIKLHTQYQVFFLYILIATFSFIFLSCIFLYRFLNIYIKKKELENNYGNFDFRAIKENLEIRYTKEGAIFIRKIQIKVLKDNYHSFLFYFNWTGDSFKIESIDGETIKKLERNQYDEYELPFDNEIFMKDDIKEIEIKHTCLSINKKPEPYFDKIFFYPIDRLYIKIYFDKDLGVKSVTKNHFRKKSDMKNPIDRKPKEYLNERDYIDWEITNPPIGSQAILNWKWKEN
jgi:hypothetical protein